jgi:hypothetical protein
VRLKSPQFSERYIMTHKITVLIDTKISTPYNDIRSCESAKKSFVLNNVGLRSSAKWKI